MLLLLLGDQQAFQSSGALRCCMQRSIGLLADGSSDPATRLSTVLGSIITLQVRYLCLARQ